jgi:gliding motility-associated-like protein
LTATATNTLVDYKWYLNGTELPNTTSQIQSINAGLFEVEVTDQGAGNCSNTASLQVVKAPVTPTNLSSAVVFCPDEGDITLDAGANFISYLWYENGLPLAGETNQTFDVSMEGVYSVEATNNFNCVTQDQSNVLEDCIPKVYGPTAFKPGGLNAEFYLFTEYVDEFEIFIYNRWGTLLFYSDDINFRWDGTFNGEVQPAAQYSYVVRYTSSFRDRGTLEQYGGVLLLR